MKLTTLSLALAASFALMPAAARADIAGDRVFLTMGAGGCPTGQTGFRRIYQSPDGVQTDTWTEFQVPAGKYLEITSIEYTFPYFTFFARNDVQGVSLNVRERGGTRSTNVFYVTYSNAPIFDVISTDTFDIDPHQYTSPGAETHVATFPAGPLVSSQARLCLSSLNFTSYGRYNIRGRLIAADPTVQPPGGGGALP